MLFYIPDKEAFIYPQSKPYAFESIPIQSKQDKNCIIDHIPATPSALISRGDLNGPITEAAKAEKSEREGSSGQEATDQEAMEVEDDKNNTSYDDKEVNDDLNNLLNQIKEGNQLDSGPFSPPKPPTTSTKTSPLKPASSSDAPSNPDVLYNCLGVDLSRLNRHWQYTYHFPLAQVCPIPIRFYFRAFFGHFSAEKSNSSWQNLEVFLKIPCLY